MEDNACMIPLVLVAGGYDVHTSGQCTLACGTSEGGIILIQLRQFIDPLQALEGRCEIELQVVVLDDHPAEADGRGITGMTWIESQTAVAIFSFHRRALH